MNILDSVRALVALVGLSAALVCSAQQPEPLAHPNLDLRAAGSISAMVRDSRGGTIIGGWFESIDGIPRRSLARLRPDGTLDPAWNAGIDVPGEVKTLAADADGSVFVGGKFSRIGGQGRAHIAKVLPSGTVDPNWNPGTDFEVTGIAIDGNGSVYVGGAFEVIGGAFRPALAKLSVSGTGTVDLAWPLPIRYFRAMTIAPDGSLYVSGGFVGPEIGLSRNLAKFSAASGTWDSAWLPDVGGVADTLVLDGSGSLLVGGLFQAVNGQLRENVARIAAGGSGELDLQWNPGADDKVTAIATDGMGFVYLAGDMNNVGGLPRNGLARIAATGSGAVDPEWNPHVAGIARALVAKPGGGVQVGGRFTSIANKPRLSHGAVDAVGSVGETVDIESGGGVQVIASQPDGSIIVGGWFHKCGNAYRANILRLTPDGILDPHWNPSTDGSVDALAVIGNEYVIVGGNFSRAGTQARRNLAKVSVNAGAEVDVEWDPSPDGLVTALAAMNDGAVFVGGSFNTIGSVSRQRIAKLSTSGEGDVHVSWTPTVDGQVRGLLPDHGGNVYVRGNFSEVSGYPMRNLAKLSASGDGDLDVTWDPLPDGSVDSFALDAAKGVLYVGGWFQSIGGQPRQNIARLFVENGSTDMSWDPGASGSVDGMALSSGDALYVVGSFGEIAGVLRSKIAKLRTQGGYLFPSWRPTIEDMMGSVISSASGAVYVSGDLVAVSGHPRRSIAALPPTSVGLEVTAVDSGVDPGRLAYRVAVVNSDPLPAYGVNLATGLSAGIDPETVTWTCTASPGSSCGASGDSGSGMLPSAIDLSVGGLVEFILSGVAVPTPADSAELAVTVTYENEPFTRRATIGFAIFRDGFESEVENAH